MLLLQSTHHERQEIRWNRFIHERSFTLAKLENVSRYSNIGERRRYRNRSGQLIPARVDLNAKRRHSIESIRNQNSPLDATKTKIISFVISKFPVA